MSSAPEAGILRTGPGSPLLLTELHAVGFRSFGPENPLRLKLRKGVNVLVGENDSGKTGIVDAIRLALGSRSEEYIRLTADDFHVAPGGRTEHLVVRCTFDDLTKEEQIRFLEWCVLEEGRVRLHIRLAGRLQAAGSGSKRVSWERNSGKDGEGPGVDGALREYLRATYLRPLRDAEAQLRAGRRSRLSEILGSLPDLRGQDKLTEPSTGEPGSTEPASKPARTLKDILSQAEQDIRTNEAISNVEKRVNEDYLRGLLFEADALIARLGLGAGLSVSQILERLELVLHRTNALPEPVRSGLGLNNILFMAAELLLLQSDKDQLPLLLIEEPEAHLHPQLQARFMEMLDTRVKHEGGPQVLLSTHSPTLAAGADLNSLILCHRASTYALDSGSTALETDDYAFLRRFLDATKANLFFARGVLIVEGDAENILLPVIAKKLGRSLTAHGVSIVNVGHVGLFRYSRIFQRKAVPLIPIPVACIADRDIAPDEAKGLDGDRPKTTQGDLTEEKLAKKTAALTRYAGDPVRVFVSPVWTLEYDLAENALAVQVHQAVGLAKEPAGKTRATVLEEQRAEVENWVTVKKLTPKEVARRIFKPIFDTSVSKAIVAEQLAQILNDMKGEPEEFEKLLPAYLVDAIKYVTAPLASEAEPEL